MKKAKRLYILLIVLAAVIVAIIIFSRYQRHVEQIKNTQEVILDVDSDEVTALSWDAEDYSYSFHNDDGWTYDEDESFPVSSEKIGELLDIFSDFKADFVIEDVSDYGQYGLDNPVATITVISGDETDEITLGDFSTMDEERYVCLNGGNVYLVETDPLESFELDLIDLMQHDTLDSISQADTITFSGLENYGIYYDEEGDKSYYPEDVYFVSGSDEPLDTSNIKRYLNNLERTDLYEYETYDATEEDLERFGFDDPVIVITVEYPNTDEDGEEITSSVTLTVAENPDELAALADDEDDSEVSKYVRVNDSPIIYDLSESDFSCLTAASYDDLRHLEVLAVDFADVYQIDITLEDTVYTIYSETDGEEDSSGDEEPARSYYYYYDGEPVDAGDLDEDDDIDNYRKKVNISTFSDLVEDITANSFTDEEPTEQEEIGLTVYLDNDKYPQVTLQLYRYDGSSCLAVLDGEPVALVDRSAVVDLIEEVYEIVL